MLIRRSRAAAFMAAGTAAFAIIGGGVALAGTDGSSTATSSAQLKAAATTPTTAITAVGSDITANFALFRNYTASPLPADVAAQVGSPERYGRNPNLARQIQTVTGKGWVIPGNGYLCVVVPDPVDGYGTSCVTTAEARTQGLYVGLTGGGVPAGKSAETLISPDGSSASLAKTGTTVADANSDGVVSALVPTGESIVAAAK